MSQYNKTVLTRAGLELAKRANAGQAKFGITRAVTSADDWSHKTVQDLEAVTTIPNIMQQGTIMDANEVESNNSVIGVSLCFTNKNLSIGYQIRIIGLYVKEEGQENDFLYAVTTAITPEYMPSFADKVLYRFNMQMYCVIGKAQAVNVVIDDGTAVTHGQFDKYKDEINKSIEAVAEAHTEDMKKVVKSATINGGAKVTPDGDGNLALVVPDPDLSDLAHKSELVPKADKTYVDDKVDAIDFSRIKFRKQYVNGDGDKVDKTWSATKNDDGTYTIDLYNDDWTASKLFDVISQLPSKADKSNTYTKTDVDSKVNEAKSTAQSSANQIWGEVNNLNGTNTRNDAVDVNTLEGIANKVTVYRLTNGNNKNTPSWIGDHRGVMIVLNYDGNAKTQIWTPVGAGAKDSTGTFGWRYWEGENPPAWNQFSSLSYVDARYQNALPKSGGNMNQRSTINWTGGGINDKTGNLGGLYWSGGTDSAAIFADQDANDNLDLVFKLGDDDSNHFSFRNAAGQEKAAILANGQINSPTIQDLYNKLAQYTVDYNNNYVHDTTIDFNSYLHETRTIKVANVKANNGPLANTATIWGWLTTYHWDDNSVTQEYRDAGGEVFWRATNASASRQWTWHKYAKQEDIDNQQRQINDLINNINYIKDNYVEGRRFPASQEAQANSWENENPQRIAFITK